MVVVGFSTESLEPTENQIFKIAVQRQQDATTFVDYDAYHVVLQTVNAPASEFYSSILTMPRHMLLPPQFYLVMKSGVTGLVFGAILIMCASLGDALAIL